MDAAKGAAMQGRGWKERVLESTRGRVVTLLRRGERTVNELAEDLGLTDNAVRTHLASLERDGLIAMRGVRRGVGKPAYLYSLTPEAETLFPRAYGVVLRTLVRTLRDTLPPEQVEAMVAETGRRLADGIPRASGDLPRRAEAAVAVLAELGGLAEWRADGAAVEIRGFGCPLREAVDDSPLVCRIAAALLSEVVGRDVAECCERGEAPSCRFRFAGA
jgi:predicted ArsR family transcriptional regulator